MWLLDRVHHTDLWCQFAPIPSHVSSKHLILYTAPPPPPPTPHPPPHPPTPSPPTPHPPPPTPPHPPTPSPPHPHPPHTHTHTHTHPTPTPTPPPPFWQTTFSNCIFLNRNDRIPIQISFNYAPRSTIDNKPALVQVMAWCRTGDKPLPEPMVTQFSDAYMRH